MKRLVATLILLATAGTLPADDVYFSVRPRAGGTGEWRRIDAPFKEGPEADEYRKTVLDPHFEVRVERATVARKDAAAPAAAPLDREPAAPELLRKSHSSSAARGHAQEDAVAAFAAAVGEMKRANDALYDVVRRIDSRLARVEADMASVSGQLTDKESRISKLERGAVTATRAPTTLTDPVAAAAAGRVAGSYDQWGRFVPPGSAPLPPPTFQTFAPFPTGVVPSAAMTAPVFFQPAASYQSAGAGACSSGSCGSAGGRRGMLGRLRGR